MTTVRVLEIVRDQTRNAPHQPMWRIRTTDSTITPYVFADGLGVLGRWGTQVLERMPLGEVLDFSQTDFQVTVTPETSSKNKLFYRILYANPMPENATIAQPLSYLNVEKVQIAAMQQATMLLASPIAVVFDLETTGLNFHTSQIIEIGAATPQGDTLLAQVIRPSDAELKTYAGSEIESKVGIDVAMLNQSPKLRNVAPQIHSVLNGKLWLVYNADFDVSMLNAAFAAHEIVPPVPLAVVCVMRLYAQYAGDYDRARETFKVRTLSEAASTFGVNTRNAHRAISDVIIITQLLRAMSKNPPNGPKKS